MILKNTFSSFITVFVLPSSDAHLFSTLYEAFHNSDCIVGWTERLQQNSRRCACNLKNLSCRSDPLTSPEMGSPFKTEEDTRQKLLKEPPII